MNKITIISEGLKFIAENNLDDIVSNIETFPKKFSALLLGSASCLSYTQEFYTCATVLGSIVGAGAGVYLYNKAFPRYISLKDAIRKFGEKTQCYYVNGHDKMWEQEPFKLTAVRYYALCLLTAADKRELTIYGIKTLSSNRVLQKISADYFSISQMNKSLRDPEYDVIYSELHETLYTNLVVKISELDKLIAIYMKPSESLGGGLPA